MIERIAEIHFSLKRSGLLYKLLGWCTLMTFFLPIHAQERPNILWMRGGHANLISSIAVSPDRLYLASASHDYTVKLWRLADKQLLRTFSLGTMVAARAVAFSANSLYLAAGWNDGRITVWNVSTGELVREFVGGSASVNVLRFSPNSDLLISGDGNGQLRIWNVSNAQLVRTIQTNATIWDLDITLNQPLIVVALGTGVIQLWDSQTGNWVRQVSTHAGPVYTVQFSPDGNHIVAGGAGMNHLSIVRTADGMVLRTLTGHTQPVLSARFVSSGDEILSTSLDGTIRRWLLNEGTGTVVLSRPSGYYETCLAIGETNSFITGGNDCHLKVWSLSSGQLLTRFTGHTGSVGALAFSADSSQLASGGQDALLWNAVNGALLRSIDVGTNEVASLAFSPDGALLAIGSGNWIDDSAREGIVAIYDTATGTESSRLTAHSDFVEHLQFASTQSFLLSAGADTAILWNRSSWQQLLNWTTSGYIQVATLSPDDMQVVIGDSNGAVARYSTLTGQQLTSFTVAPDVPRSAALSASTQLLASSNEQNTIRLWNLTTGQLLHTLSGHSDVITGITFSPDGRYLLSASRDKTLRFWRVSDGALLHTYTDEVDVALAGASSVCFAPSGRYFAYGRVDGTVVVARNPYAVHGDVNGDGCINDADLLSVLFDFGQSGSGLASDVNEDGTVNDADLLIVLFNFGQGCQ